MRHSEEKMRKMLLALQKSGDFVTLDSLSHMLEISKRSVQNYLNKAEAWLREHDLPNVQIVKKQGYGIQLVMEPADQQKLATLLSSRYFTLADGSVDRRIELLRCLVFSREELTIQLLADKFYVSRFVILSDLDWAENWLANYNLKLFKTQRRGIGIVGDEVSRRAAIAGFFDLQELKEPAVGNASGHTVRLAKERLQKMEEVYTEADIKKVCSIIEEAEREFDFFMGSEYFTALATHITISVFRLRHGCQIEKEFLPPDGEFPQLEMNTAQFIAKRLEETFSIRLPVSECTYICIHLMSYNAFREQSEAGQRVPENIEMLTLHLLEAVDAQMGGNFSSDKILFFGLVYHLRNSVYQQKENPGARARKHIELPEAYRELYDSVKSQSALYREYGGISPDNQELISLTLHFALSMERTTAKWRVLLVTNTGVMIQRELREYLQKQLPQIKIIDTCSNYQFSVYPDNACDFIISSVSLENTEKPVASIAHMTRIQMVQYLEEFIFTKMENKDDAT